MAERRPLFDALVTPGSRIGPYEVTRRIGSGGMGTVYLCKAVESCPVSIGRIVAIKVLRNSDGDERKRFERESRYLQSLQHPGIVRVLDTGEDREQLYLVMPLIDGKRLDDLVGAKKAPLAIEKAVDWMVQGLEALHVAHLAGILHRDIKPGNLMLDKEGRIKLLDFGLASAPDYESRLTRDGDVVGTPAYMPPEQAAGRRDDISRRSDIYGMGACLYELLTGRQPYEADNAMATLRAIIDEPLVKPSKWRPDLPRDVETVVLVAMAKDPRDRYRTAEEMAGDLRRIRNGARIRAKRVSTVAQLWRSSVRHRSTVAAVALVIFAIGAAATFVTFRAIKLMHERTEEPDLTGNVWTKAWDYPATPADAHLGNPAEIANTLLVWTDHAPFGPQAQVANLPAVDGAVRLTASFTLNQAPVISADASAKAKASSKDKESTAFALMINDRDIGGGYSLRLDLAATGDCISLWREGHAVRSLEIGQTPRGVRLHLQLEHLDGALTGSIAYDPTADGQRPQVSFSFLDLAPLQGSDANGVYLMRTRTLSEVDNVLLQRQRSGELVSALTTADAFRQDKRFARAQQLYQAFIRDHPDSAQSKDAKLRLGLCQEGLEDTAGALATFINVVEENRNDPRYVLVATFHAWACALKLGRYTEAEGYFEAITRSYDLATLAASIPESTLKDLRQDYANRAMGLAGEDPDRAVNLALAASEIARYLGETTTVADGMLLAGDLLLTLGRLEVARETYLRAVSDPRLDQAKRLQGLIGMGHAERLLGNFERAAEAYKNALKQAPANQRGRIQLWLGDLAAEAGDTVLAEATWREHTPGIDATTRGLLRRLTDYQELIRDAEPLAKDFDAAYVNARILLQMGDKTEAKEWLARAATQTPNWRWPVPLAKTMLESLEPE